jgi:hypothetical protein
VNRRLRKTDVAGQQGQDNQDKISSAGQPGQDSWDRTAKDKTAGTIPPGGIGQPGRTVEIVQIGKEREDRRPEHDSKEMTPRWTARTGQLWPNSSDRIFRVGFLGQDN